MTSFIFLTCFILCCFSLRNPKVKAVAFFTALILAIEMLSSSYVPYLPINKICVIAIILDGLLASLVLWKYRFPGYLFYVILCSISITLTFYLGMYELFPPYRELINVIMSLQLCTLVLSDGYRRRFLAATYNVCPYK